MKNIADIPFFEIEFDKEGKLHTPDKLEETIRFLNANNTTDLLVISHGWNNDITDARSLYQRFFSQAASLVKADQIPDLDNRDFVILGLYWPSKKFTEQDLIPGGAASLGDAESEGDLLALIEGLKTEPVQLGDERPIAATDQAKLDQAKMLVPRLENDPDARRMFVDLIRSILPRTDVHPDDGSEQFFKRDPEDLLQEASLPVLVLDIPPEDDMGGVASGREALVDFDEEGGTAGILGDLFSGINAGARRLLNFTTYYRVKTRAGVVGREGLAPVVTQIREQSLGTKVHLIGHSFGGRLVTAATHALTSDRKIDSLSLLQAAFSHNGFAQRFNGRDDGFFRTMITAGKVSGSVLITHSRKDSAVGIAYPLASRVAGQNAAGLGDRNDPYGGLGRNGAIFTPEASNVNLENTGHSYGLVGGKLYNLKADRFIRGHSDITGEQVVYAVLCAVSAT